MGEPIYKKVRLEIGECDIAGTNNVYEVEFVGRLLASSRLEIGIPPHTNNCGTLWRVYETIREKIVVWRKNWSLCADAIDTAEMSMYSNIGEIEGKVPNELFLDAKRKLDLYIIERSEV